MKLHGAEPKWTAWSVTKPVLSSPVHEFEQIKFYCVDAFQGHSHSKTCPCNPRFSSGGWICSIQYFFTVFLCLLYSEGIGGVWKNALPNSTQTFANKFLHGSATSRPSWTKCTLVATFFACWPLPRDTMMLSRSAPATIFTQPADPWHPKSNHMVAPPKANGAMKVMKVMQGMKGMKVMKFLKVIEKWKGIWSDHVHPQGWLVVMIPHHFRWTVCMNFSFDCCDPYWMKFCNST